MGSSCKLRTFTVVTARFIMSPQTKGPGPPPHYGTRNAARISRQRESLLYVLTVAGSVGSMDYLYGESRA